MAKSVRMNLKITEEIDRAIRSVSKETRIPVSILVRDAIVEMLAGHGYKVSADLPVGGNRRAIVEPLEVVSDGHVLESVD